MSIYSSSIRDLTYKFDYAKHPFRLSLKKKKKTNLSVNPKQLNSVFHRLSHSHGRRKIWSTKINWNPTMRLRFLWFDFNLIFPTRLKIFQKNQTAEKIAKSIANPMICYAISNDLTKIWIASLLFLRSVHVLANASAFWFSSPFTFKGKRVREVENISRKKA